MAWFSLWVREVVGSIPTWPPFNNIFFYYKPVHQDILMCEPVTHPTEQLCQNDWQKQVVRFFGLYRSVIYFVWNCLEQWLSEFPSACSPCQRKIHICVLMLILFKNRHLWHLCCLRQDKRIKCVFVSTKIKVYFIRLPSLKQHKCDKCHFLTK